MMSRRLKNRGGGLGNGMSGDKRMVTRGMRDTVAEASANWARIHAWKKLTPKQQQDSKDRQQKGREDYVLKKFGRIAWLKFKAGHIREMKRKAQLKAHHEMMVDGGIK